MSKGKFFLAALTACSLVVSCNATIAAEKNVSPTPQQSHEDLSKIDKDSIKQLLQQMVDVNVRFKDKFHSVLSESSLKKQTPHATVVMCSDSRVDMDILSDTPSGEMFVIRNIGNQLSTAYGSVEYGVEHLKTQLLVIVGHSKCGAIKAAMTDYHDESKHIRAELNSLKADPKDSLNTNIVDNVQMQVKTALKTFAKKVKSGEVVVLGMIYDMHNDFKYGSGQLILVSLNGESDPKVLASNQYLEGLKNLVILGDH